MSKLFSNKALIISAFLAMALLYSVMVSYTKASIKYRQINQCCRKMQPKGGEMPWENLTRHFVSAVLFQ